MKIRHTLVAPLLLGLLQLSQAAEAPLGLTPPPPPTVDDSAVLVIPHPDQSVLLRNADPALLANKQLVYTMWRTIMSAGQVEKLPQFSASDLQQHNPVIATGLAAYQQWLQPQLKRSETVPATISEPLITMVAEGDKVGLAFVTEYPEPDGSGKTYTSTHFYLYRIANGKIAEQWESVQVPTGMVPIAVTAGGPRHSRRGANRDVGQPTAGLGQQQTAGVRYLAANTRRRP
jgi:predicted SnoaL-like aldol condensation-catalyzing enzyme